MAKAREPKVFKSMDDLPLMLTPYDLMDFLGKGQRQTYELIHSEGFPYVQDGPKIKIPKWLVLERVDECMNTERERATAARATRNRGDRNVRE